MITENSLHIKEDKTTQPRGFQSTKKTQQVKIQHLCLIQTTARILYFLRLNIS